MRVLIVSEGFHELTGALEAFVRRLIEVDIEPSFEKLSHTKALHWQGKGAAHLKRAIKWMEHATKEGFEAVVIVCDQDDVNRHRKQDPLKQYDDAQASTNFPIPRAMGVAIRSFDAWILADDSALSAVLGKSVSRQPDPEQIKDPKSKCKVLRDASEITIDLRDMYAAVANKANLDTIAERCPKGFAPFAKRVRELRAVS